MNPSLGLVWLGLAASALVAVHGDAQIIGVAAPVQISPPGAGLHWFTSISAAPNNAQDLMACGIRQSPFQNSWQGFVYMSHDGGAHWITAFVDSSTQAVSEETCAFGSAGTAYFVAQPWGPRDWAEGTATTESVLHLYRTNDDGYTWSGPVVDRRLDYARMAVDNTSGRYQGRVYLFGNASFVQDADGTPWSEKELLYFSDGGRTIGPRIRPLRPHEYRTLGNFPQYTRVLPDGAILAVYWTRYVPFSADSLRAPACPHATLDNFFHRCRFMIEAVRATDGGQTVERTSVITRLAESTDAIPGMDVDRSDGPRRGTVYVTWSDSVRGRERVILATSVDGGRTWGTPRAVDDVPMGRKHSMARGPGAGNPSIAVNPGGVIGITWAEQHGACLRFTASLDGGETFLPSVPLNRCPRTMLGGTHDFGSYLWAVPYVEFTSAQMLDTMLTGVTIRVFDNAGWSWLPYGLAAAADGTFHPLWVLPRDGGGRLWTTSITVGQTRSVLSTCASVPELTDVTSRARFTLTNAQYDEATQVASVDVSLFNKDSLALWRPICLQAIKVQSAIADVEVVDADSGNAHQGATWDLSGEIDDDMWRPYRGMRPRRLSFRLRNLKQPLATANLYLSLIAAQLRVLARLTPQ